VRRIGHELEHLDRRVKAKTRRRIGTEDTIARQAPTTAP